VLREKISQEINLQPRHGRSKQPDGLLLLCVESEHFKQRQSRSSVFVHLATRLSLGNGVDVVSLLSVAVLVTVDSCLLDVVKHVESVSSRLWYREAVV
jgi:hypothetical protein